jgi:hypothetical protein
VSEPLQDHELLGLAGARKHRFALLRRHQTVIVRRDEQNRPRRDAVDDPFGIEAERVADEFERQLCYGRRIVTARRRAQLGRLPVGQQDLVAVHEIGYAGQDALVAVRRGARQQVVVFIRAAYAAHPARPVADSHHRDNAPDAQIDGCDEDDGAAAIARAVDAEARGIDLGLRAEKGQRRLDVGDPAIWRQAALRPSLSPQPL